MRLIKVVVLSVILALIVYVLFRWLSTRKTFVSPIPEEGIKVIEVSPSK